MHLKMNPSHQYANNVITSILVLFFIIPLRKAQKYDMEFFSTCRSNTTFDCGDTTLTIKYAFWGGNRPSYCGLEGYELGCVSNDIPDISIGSGDRFQVVEINPSTTSLILERADNHLLYRCPTRHESVKLNKNLFSYGMGTVDLYLIVCPVNVTVTTIGVGNNLTCEDDNYETRQVIFVAQSVLRDHFKTLYFLCYWIKVPVDRNVLEEFTNNATRNTAALLESTFQVNYFINQTACSECEKSGGECWQSTNSTDSNKQCLYAQPGKTQKLRLKIGLAGGAVGVSILFLILFFFIPYWRKKSTDGSSLFSHNASSYPKDVEAFIRQYGSSTPNRFRYSSLSRITNSFKDELGKGGYGNVFKGTLPDGRLVAVKVLNSTEGNGEEFMNEVASIGRTSHVNVVTLLGFCYEGKRRALIYEYMPNGSLEKFIYGTTRSSETQHLGWERLYNIAFGIARGLEYLHNGCNTPILHLDIKPHNILLDEDFCPKISDFGLANNELVRKMMIVGLWCIQTNPLQRPSIGKVIEMFEGHISPLELPPKPDLYSIPNFPSTSQQKSFSGSSSQIESNTLPKLVPRSHNSS